MVVGTPVIVYVPLKVASTPVITISIPVHRPCATVVVNVAMLDVSALLLMDTVIAGKTLSASYSSARSTPLYVLPFLVHLIERIVCQGRPSVRIPPVVMC